MPGAVLHQGATVLCPHGGQAFPTTSSPRVLVSGRPVVGTGAGYAVSGCPVHGAGGPPCVTATWVSGAVRVLVGGEPVVVSTGASVAMPGGAPLVPVAHQLRVVAT